MAFQINWKKALGVAIATALLSMTSARAAEPATVTTGADDGPGSLRQALASGTGLINISPSVSTITIESTLMYTGSEPIRIMGRGQTILANTSGDDFTLLEISNGANITISNLTFDGGGGFDFDNAGVGKGIFVSVPIDRTGVVNLDLSQVTVTGVANHGIHVSDCTLGDDCGSGSGGGGEGSPASIHVQADRVTVNSAGTGKFDADGLRVDERADGSILARINRSSFLNVGADGIELDEGNDGDVIIDVRNSIIDDNGGYCLPAPMDLSEPCVEDDDGELVLDLDDAIDVDEAGAGSFSGLVAMTHVRGNLDEGLDFDEEGPGGVNLDLRGITGNMNGDEAVKVSSANEGNVFVTMRNMLITDNDNDGIQIEAEDGDGQVHVTFINSTSTGNSSDGLQVTQENEVDLGTLKIRGDSTVDSIDTENVVET